MEIPRDIKNLIRSHISPALSQIKPIEPIPGDDRLTAFPISRPGVWEYYKDARRCFWTPDEVDLSKDREHYLHHPKMTDGIRRALDYIMAFFASLDKLVNNNILERFRKDFDFFEASCFYSFQETMENIHSETYALQLDTIVPDAKRKQFLLDSVQTIPVVKKMADWIHQCINSEAPAGERLLRMACVEGIFFMGAFCILYWVQDLGMMPGLTQANELIARDESLHTRFALFLYLMLVGAHKVEEDSQVYAIFKDAVDIGFEFAQDAIPVELPEMNSTLMRLYLQCQADNLLALLGLKPCYGSKNPFHYMAKQNMVNRGNFFERKVTEYAKPKSSDRTEFERVDDF